MKTLSLTLLTLFLSVSVFSQTHKTVLTKEANMYFEYMSNQNFDGVLDYMYPKIFESAPRESMKQGMEQMFNAEDMKIQFLSNNVTKITDQTEADGINYAAIFYDSTMKMTFLSELNQPKEEREGFLMFMKATMESQFGEGNVTEEKEEMALIIKMSATMFAINDPQYDSWKFLGNDDAMKTLVSTIIPDRVKTELLNEKE